MIKYNTFYKINTLKNEFFFIFVYKNRVITFWKNFFSLKKVLKKNKKIKLNKNFIFSLKMIEIDESDIEMSYFIKVENFIYSLEFSKKNQQILFLYYFNLEKYFEYVLYTNNIKNLIKKNKIEFIHFDNPSKLIKTFKSLWIYNTEIEIKKNYIIFNYPKNEISISIKIIENKLNLIDEKIEYVIINEMRYDEIWINNFFENLQENNNVKIFYEKNIEEEYSYIFLYTRDKFTYGDDNIKKMY